MGFFPAPEKAHQETRVPGPLCGTPDLDQGLPQGCQLRVRQYLKIWGVEPGEGGV